LHYSATASLVDIQRAWLQKL